MNPIPIRVAQPAQRFTKISNMSKNDSKYGLVLYTACHSVDLTLEVPFGFLLFTMQTYK